jgi:hypothetical protein
MGLYNQPWLHWRSEAIVMGVAIEDPATLNDTLLAYYLYQISTCLNIQFPTSPVLIIELRVFLF